MEASAVVVRKDSLLDFSDLAYSLYNIRKSIELQPNSNPTSITTVEGTLCFPMQIP